MLVTRSKVLAAGGVPPKLGDARRNTCPRSESVTLKDVWTRRWCIVMEPLFLKRLERETTFSFFSFINLFIRSCEGTYRQTAVHGCGPARILLGRLLRDRRRGGRRRGTRLAGRCGARLAATPSTRLFRHTWSCSCANSGQELITVSI